MFDMEGTKVEKVSYPPANLNYLFLAVCFPWLLVLLAVGLLFVGFSSSAFSRLDESWTKHANEVA